MYWSNQIIRSAKSTIICTKRFGFLTEDIVDTAYCDLSIGLKRVISNSREVLCQHYEIENDLNSQRYLLWSNITDDRLIVLCGLSSENLSEV